MTAPRYTEQPSAPRRQHAARSGGRPAGDEGGYTAEVALQVGEAAQVLGERLRDPALPHGVEDLAGITRGFAATAEGMAAGVAGITEWLRAAGHAGTLSGHASVVADRLGHVGRELDMLAEAVRAAEHR
ncbi:hypothetical protein ACL03H_11580 [Saccharopolyspora sp. MS10]|uniref:hypothetical protein n=1 Tax=Saccharopolyspora sp. MS10 TaxID=3385973 RepID=UPI0039A3A485